MRRKIVISALIGVALLSASCGPNVSIPPAAITGDNSGGAIAVYQMQMSDSYGQFYVQKISPEGDFLWGEKGISIGSGYSDFGAFYSYAVSDGSGGAIVIWLEFLPRAEGEPPSFQTHVARIDSGGNVKWRQDIPGIDEAIPDGSGGVIIAYDDRHDNLFVLKIDAEGNLPWGEDGVSLNLSGYGSQRDIASDNSGGVIVVGRGFQGDSHAVFAQRVDSGGNILWQPGGVQACVGPVGAAQVVSDGSGGGIIAYERNIPCEDGRTGYCDSDIYAQRIDAGGNVLWGPDGVPICTGPSVPNSPRIVTDGAGGAVIYFAFIGNEVSAPGYFAFRARRIDADGHELWEEEAELWGGNIVSDGSGGIISVWYGGDEGSRRAQRLDASGTKLWGPDGTTLTLRDLHRNLVAPDGCGGVLISWSAVEFNGSKVSQVSYYVQRIDADGNLPWGDGGILLNP